MLKKWLIILLVATLPLGAGAQGIQIIPECNPVPGQPNSCGITHIFGLLVNIFDLLLALVGVVFMLVIIWAGFRFFLYQFSEKPEASLEAAKLTLKRGIFGFMIVATTFLVIRVVLVALGVNTEQMFGDAIFDPIRALLP
jgi:hypothetical protein